MEELLFEEEEVLERAIALSKTQGRHFVPTLYWNYVLRTIEQQDLARLWTIWKNSLTQATFGVKVRKVLNKAAPTIGRVKGLQLKENTFRGLMEAHDRKRINELCGGKKNCLLTFVEEDNLYALKQLVPGGGSSEVWEALELTIKKDNLRLFKFLLAAIKEKLEEDAQLSAEEKEFYVSTLEDFLRDAALHNSLKVIDLLLQEGVNLDYGLVGAAQGNHKKLIEFFIEKGADPRFLLEGAILGNHLHLLDYAQKILPFTQEVLDRALKLAVDKRQWKVAEYLHQKGAKNMQYEVLLLAQADDLEAIEKMGKTLGREDLEDLLDWLGDLDSQHAAKIENMEEIHELFSKMISFAKRRRYRALPR